MGKKSKIAVFDIDGTIFRKNLSFELINELSWMGIFQKSVRKELVHHYTNWLNHKGVYDDYRQALVKLYEENIKGCKREDVIKASKIVVPFYKDRTYIFANNLIKKFKEEGYYIIAISGSPSEIVEEYNKYLKFDAAFGTIYETDKNDFYTGKYIFETPKDKGLVVRQYLAENNLTLEGSFGVGDTESDIKFLEMVENPIAFNPNANLKKIAEEKKWRIVVEKKDVIYEIN
ncbi:MAG: HAD-IB family hydrolase [Candidatus Moranbacteria bacterium CG10_big_fil_rev_8_21_14_0_10_35_21]|nr:MAG: HAD-IB family hydrolase [Candidatus Moranbacteria bacterium CG10_big_fil_rev_8_21_14_0_10_35_21]PJA88343.1 MAG: HAD-IB family hydrolase [Candidatus Moranbacteria bacterium CG_4_9_14_3_um_filter_36_9]